jgi:hypothetical protein
MSLFLAILGRAAIGAFVAIFFVAFLQSYSEPYGKSLLSGISEPPSVTEPTVLAVITLGPEHAKCEEWDHANRFIDYCPNPGCPGLRENKLKRSLTGAGWVKAYPVS